MFNCSMRSVYDDPDLLLARLRLLGLGLKDLLAPLSFMLRDKGPFLMRPMLGGIMSKTRLI